MGEVSAGARGGGGKWGEVDKTRALWFFSRHLVAVMARVLPFARGEYPAGVRLVVVAAVAARPELLDVLVPQQRELPVARRGGPERHLCAIQHLAPRALERVRRDAPHAPDAAHVEEPAVGGVEAGLVLAGGVALAAGDGGGARGHRGPRRGEDHVGAKTFWRVPWHS